MKDDSSEKSIVFVVDDDPLVRESVSNLLRSVGLQTRVFGSTSDFCGKCGLHYRAVWCSTSGYPAQADWIFRPNYRDSIFISPSFS